MQFIDHLDQRRSIKEIDAFGSRKMKPFVACSVLVFVHLCDERDSRT